MKSSVMGRKLYACIIIFALLFLPVMIFSCAPSAAPSEGEKTAPEETTKEPTEEKDDLESMKPINLSFAHFWAAEHDNTKLVLDAWMDAVSEATNQKITFTKYPGGTLLGQNETYEGVVNGVADVGASFFSYTRGRFPVLEAFELPGFMWDSAELGSRVSWEGIQRLQKQGMLKEVEDTKLMFVYSPGPQNIMTGSRPIKSLEDLQGMEIRATGLCAQVLEALGAVPVAMGMNETYEALSKGVVQGTMGPNNTLEGWKLGEVCKYVTESTFLYNSVIFVTMNLDVWNSLPESVQAIIEEVNAEIFEGPATEAYDMQNDRGLKWAIDECGIEVITLSEDEVERWISKVKPLQDEYVSRMEAQGLPGREVLDLIEELVDKYR